MVGLTGQMSIPLRFRRLPRAARLRGCQPTSQQQEVALGLGVGRLALAYLLLRSGGGAVLTATRDAAFSVNDWAAFVIFIPVMAGIGTIEGPNMGLKGGDRLALWGVASPRHQGPTAIDNSEQGDLVADRYLAVLFDRAKYAA
jgi:hypothetical protein